MPMQPDYEYAVTVHEILDNGQVRRDRTGVGTIALFGQKMTFDLRDGFPLLTTKAINFGAIADELLWFIRGGTNANELSSKIWQAWADDNGDLGPIYGAQWRKWGSRFSDDTIDQLANVIQEIKDFPHSRRLLVSAWNVGELHMMALAPCHVMFQFYVDGDYLDLQLYQRSADMGLGVPYNIASYALLLSLVANECGLVPRILHHVLGDAHVYSNHVAKLQSQIEREPRPSPHLLLKPGQRVFDVTAEDITLIQYDPHPAVHMTVAV